MTAVVPGAADAAPLGAAPAVTRRPASLLPPLRGLLPLGVLLVVWQLSAPRLPPYFPPPSEWAVALLELWDAGLLVPAAAATLRTFGLGLFSAIAVGTALGVALGASTAVDRALRPTLEFARAMPPAAVVPIATLLLGFTGTMKVVVVTSAALWSILLNARSGVRQLDPVLLDAARSLHLSRRQRLGKVVLPALVPSVLVGVRIAAPVALVITLLVEILTQVDGIGALIGLSQRNFQFARGYGLVLVAALFSLAVNLLVSTVQGYVMRHRPPSA